jgi:hypothetical protein
MRNLPVPFQRGNLFSVGKDFLRCLACDSYLPMQVYKHVDGSQS